MQLRTHQILRSPYIYQVTTCADSRHFDSPPERCHFEDIAGVVGNSCIERGSSSTVVDGQTTVYVFQDPDKNIFPFRTSPAIIYTPHISSDIGNGQFKFGADLIRRYGDIFT